MVRNLKTFPPRLEIRQGCSFSLSFNIMLEILAHALRQGKKMKGIQFEKK